MFESRYRGKQSLDAIMAEICWWSKNLFEDNEGHEIQEEGVTQAQEEDMDFDYEVSDDDTDYEFSDDSDDEEGPASKKQHLNQ